MYVILFTTDTWIIVFKLT